MKPATVAEGGVGADDFFTPSVKLLCGNTEKLTGFLESDIGSDLLDNLYNNLFILFPESFMRTKIVDNEFIETDDIESGLIESHETRDFGNFMESMDIGHERFVGIETDDMGHIPILPFMACGSGNGLCFFTRKESQFEFQDMRWGVTIFGPFIREVNDFSGLHAA